MRPRCKKKRKVIIMKTRKVGKIVSLLVAIVLVATIMIPAASVLAQNSAENAFDDKNCVEINDFFDLKDTLDVAPTDGSKLYIKLTGNVEMNVPYSQTRDGLVGTGKLAYFQKEELFVNDYYPIQKKGLLYYVHQSAQLSLETFLEEVAVKSPIVYNSEVRREYKTDGTIDRIVYEVKGDNIAEFERVFKLGEDKWNADNTSTKGRPAYEESMLIINENANVVIDLNGYSIKGPNGSENAYTGTPAYQNSVFIVKGTLTVMDRSPEQTGAISGGTGYVLDTCQVSSNDAGRHHSNVTEDFKYINDNKGCEKVLGVNSVTVDSKTWRHICHESRLTYWYNSATESKGGGVIIFDGGEFNLVSGKITKNCAWMQSGVSIFAEKQQSVAMGGGVYVSAGATFNMTGGEISNNAARAYQGEANSRNAWAYGGGVYLAPASDGKVATFNMTGGRVAENAAYGNVWSTGAGGNSKSTTAYGAGVYVGTGAVCNIIGNEVEEGPTTTEMLQSFPRITNNSCGGTSANAKADWTVQADGSYKNAIWVAARGAGVYCDGTLNIQNAVVSANEFAEFAGDIDKLSAGTDLTQYKVVHINNDKITGLPNYILDYNADGSAKTLITRLDSRFTENLELATEELTHETSGIYGTGRGNNTHRVSTDGAGVYVSENAKMYVGSRTWITDNYDLMTTCHKAFNKTRDYDRYWDKTADGGAGRYIYTGSEISGISDGYVFSDTRDDVYLPEGVTMYKGDYLFESKIGVNYYDMVDKEGAPATETLGRASNRVFIKTATDLDANIWGHTSSAPTQSDIQFFSLNDNNKNYERDNYNDLSRTKDTVVGDAVDCELLDPELLDSSTGDLLIPGGWAARDDIRVSVIDTSNFTSTQGQYRKNYLSPYQGYVDFDIVYPANTWYYSSQLRYDESGNLGNKGESRYLKHNAETYFMADADKSPTTSAIHNTNVVFPQRAYQIDSTAAALHESEQRAKFMDYKVVYDATSFGSASAPVLRFGKSDREMYVSYDFEESGITYYGKNSANQTLDETIDVDTLLTDKTVFKTINTAADGSSFTFYGANKPTGTLILNKIVPDYKAYKGASVLNNRINNRKSELSSLTVTNGTEDSDLYFKGWSFYTSYGYGPETMVLSNNDALEQINVGNDLVLDYRGTFVVDLNKILNLNVNAQPCPTMTALWYTKDELAQARKNVSNVMCQQVKRQDGDNITNLLRFVSIAGSNYVDFDEVGFVISTTNATPTIEGGYDFIAKSAVYEKLAFNPDKGESEKQYYDVDKLLGGSYSGGYSVPVVDAQWTFTEGSQFAANVTTGVTGKTGYKDAGLFYANIIITDANKDTVYFATPYAKIGNTYYYGESRGIAYSDITAQS